MSETSDTAFVLSDRLGACVKSVGSGISAGRVALSACVGDTEVREEGDDITKGESDFEVDTISV